MIFFLFSGMMKCGVEFHYSMRSILNSSGNPKGRRINTWRMEFGRLVLRHFVPHRRYFRSLLSAEFLRLYGYQSREMKTLNIMPLSD